MEFMKLKQLLMPQIRLLASRNFSELPNQVVILEAMSGA